MRARWAGPPGDVYVSVEVRPIEGLRRAGDDLVARASVTMVEAAIGTTITVPTPTGTLEVELAPGTQPGAVHAVRGRGMPSLETGRHGDLLVEVDVRVPNRLTPEQRVELLRLEEDARRGCVPRRRRRVPREAEERVPVSGGPPRTALVVVADDAEEATAPWRRRYNRSAVERRMPAHVTILFPLVPAAAIDDDLLSGFAVSTRRSPRSAIGSRASSPSRRSPGSHPIRPRRSSS